MSNDTIFIIDKLKKIVMLVKGVVVVAGEGLLTSELSNQQIVFLQ